MGYTLPTVLLNPGVPQSISLQHPVLVNSLKVTNKSPYDLQYSDFGVIGFDWIPAGTEYMLYGSIQNNGQITLLAVNTTNVFPANPGAVLLSQYQHGEEIPHGQWPVSIPFQTVGSTVTTATRLIDDIDFTNTTMIESTVLNDTHGSSVVITNNGNVTLGNIQSQGGVGNTGNVVLDGYLDLKAIAAPTAAFTGNNQFATPIGSYYTFSVTGGPWSIGINQPVSPGTSDGTLLIMHHVSGQNVTFSAAGSNVSNGSLITMTQGDVFFFIHNSNNNLWNLVGQWNNLYSNGTLNVAGHAGIGIAPNANIELLVQPDSDGVIGFQVIGHSGTQTADIFDVRDSTSTSIYFRVAANGTVGIRSTTSALTTNGAIDTSKSFTKPNPAGAVTGISMAAGAFDGQICFVDNVGAGSITFAGAGSNVKESTVGIAAGNTNLFIWSTTDSLWHRVNVS